MTPGTLGRGFQRATELINHLEAAGVPVTDAAVATADDAVTLTIEIEYSLSDPAGADIENLQLGTGDEQPHEEAPESDEQPPELTTTSPHAATRVPTPLLRDVDGEETMDPESESEPVDAHTESGTETTPTSGEEGTSETTDEETASGSDASESTDEDADQTGFTCSVDGCTGTFGSEHGLKIHVGRVHGANHTPHRDPEILAELYERYDTFEEMADAVDSDVSAQTVRRQMIHHGIHVPGSNGVSAETEREDREAAPDEAGSHDTHSSELSDEASTAGSSDELTTDPPTESAAGSPSEPTTTAEVSTAPETEPDEEQSSEDITSQDGVDAKTAEGAGTADDSDVQESNPPPLDKVLEEGITVGDLKCAVEGATTIYEVQRNLDIDREVAVDLLQHTGLLDLVQGRAAQKFERDRRKAEIDERLATVLAA